MEKTTRSPWASGPGEILRHGLGLLKQDTDVNRRLAMILIDNAVELMIKTYLGLPRRITGLSITRKDYLEFSESFPKLLDALEEHASDKLVGVDLGSVEWYHRVRNQLYHDGNGLTVERDQVEIYAGLANVLFESLFEFHLVEPEDVGTKLLVAFMEAWVAFEKAMTAIALLHSGGSGRGAPDTIRFLAQKDVISPTERTDMDYLRTLRNDIVHGSKDYREILKPPIVERLRELTAELEKRRGELEDF